MKKTKKVIVIALAAVAVCAVAFAIEEHRASRMISYANEHNCTWYNVTTEPVCK